MTTKDLLFEMCALNGPTGFETDVAAYCATKLKNYTSHVTQDRLGNTLASFASGKKGAKKIMLDAHVDELGLIVNSIEEGFLRFSLLGGIDPRILPGRELLILTGDKPIFGVVACLPPHLLTPDQYTKTIPVKDLYIDVGMSEEETRKNIPIGTPIVFRDSPRELQNNIFCGKAMDDRAGIVTIFRTLDLLSGTQLNIDLTVVASVQEELQIRGIGTAAFAVEPDFSISVDVTHAHSPDSKGQTYCSLGAGPCLSIGPNTNRQFTQFLQKTAETEQIPYQLVAHERHSRTNAFSIQTSRSGVVTALLEIPLRYMHSPVECVNAADIEYTARLIAASLATMTGEE
jgi:endoglucanase